MDPIIREEFDEWKHSPVTKRMFNKLQQEIEVMKDGIIYDNYENPEAVKGMCRAINNILQIEYEDL